MSSIRTRLTALALGAGLVASAQLALAPTAGAAQPPQPGTVPHMGFGETKTMGNVTITINRGEQVGDAPAFEYKVKVCNRGTEPQPVGPDTFSHTTKDYDTRLFEPHDGLLHHGLRNQWVQPGACAAGSLVTSGWEPFQLAFHDLRTEKRYDILPATEWDGIAKVGWPRSKGTSNYFGDFTGDTAADVVGLVNGNLMVYRTINGPTLRTVGDTGAHGMNSPYSWIGKVPDMDRNGASEVLARDGSGTLWQQRMMGHSRAGFPTIIGYGFSDARDMTVTSDVNGDGHPELLAIRKDGRLTRQSVKPVRVSAPVQVGQNWQGVREIFSVGDFSGDGRADLLAINDRGLLMRYTLNARGQISSTTQVGHGWTSFRQVFSPGDLNRDGRRDMVGVRSDGHLYFYANLGAGRWGKPKKIGSNWNGVSSIA